MSIQTLRADKEAARQRVEQDRLAALAAAEAAVVSSKAMAEVDGKVVEAEAALITELEQVVEDLRSRQPTALAETEAEGTPEDAAQQGTQSPSSWERFMTWAFGPKTPTPTA